MYRAADPLPYLTVTAIKVSRDAGGVEHDRALPTTQGVATATGAVVKFLYSCGPCGATTIGSSTRSPSPPARAFLSPSP